MSAFDHVHKGQFQLQLFPTGMSHPSQQPSQPPISAPSASPARDPMQMRLFMYPDEILEEYEPVSGDYRRKTDPRYLQFTDRPARTDETPNTRVSDIEPNVRRKKGTREAAVVAAKINNANVEGRKYIRLNEKSDIAETKEELLARKVKEAEESTPLGQHTYAGVRLTPGIGQRSMAQSIAEEGVRDPVWLATPDVKHGIMEGKPEIYGGHHRIATARKYAPDRPILINYAESFHKAYFHPDYR